MNIEIGGKSRPVKLKMRAVSEYKKLTGFNLAGGVHNYTDIIGSAGDKEKGIEPKEFNPDLFIAFVYSVLVNGMHPDKPDFSIDDVADWINLYDRTLSGSLYNLYMEEMTGKTAEEVMAIVEDYKKKVSQNSPGNQSSEPPTGS